MLHDPVRASVPLALPLVLCGFAANSLLCRAALGPGDADAATFAALRLGSGALALALLALLRREGWQRPRLFPSLALAAAPPWRGALALLLAGVAWGAYSLRGRGSTVPVADSAAAFLGAALLVLPAFLLPEAHHASPRAVLLAVLSGTVASGATYALWYALLPRLGAFRAAVAQLAVPLIPAAGAAALLREWPRPVWFLAALLILAGLGLALGKAPTSTPAPAPPRA
jgi:drug/metabolite transporter (DMT)-like permease